MGNLTRNPELRYTPSGTPVASFGLAVSRRFKQGEDLKEEVCFVDIVVFGKQAESVGRFVVKGKQVQARGELWQEEYQGKDGTQKTALKLNADNVLFLGSKSDGGDAAPAPAKPSASSPAKSAPARGAQSDDNDDLPF